MTKYAVYTKWHWPNGVMSLDELQKHMKDNIKPSSLADDVVWWKIDDNNHQSVIIYPTEEAAKKELAKRLTGRARDTESAGIKLLEEFMGPVMAQMSAV